MTDIVSSATGNVGGMEPPLDLDAIETDLADVEVALERLDAGTYWTCEVSGQPLPDQLLRDRPTARRISQ